MNNTFATQSSTCDKCKGEVLPNNDVTIFLVVQTGDPMYAMAISRHLLPVIVDGETVCKGSPSRAQYLEGQPRDERAAYAYNPELEADVRATYAKLLKLTAEGADLSDFPILQLPA